MTYDKIKGYFDKGFWSVIMVRNMVVKNIITAVQFTEITAEDY